MKRILIGSMLAATVLCAAARADELRQGFLRPPDSARPHTWWHWMNGNVTAEGITADLQAMKDVGVGGAQIFNVDYGIPAGPAEFMSEEWRKLVVHAVREADRLGLELCIHNCAGWSSSGGPWVKPEHAMQVVTTSEHHVQGPAAVEVALPQPPTRAGHYRDVAVLAFPTPGGNPDADAVRIEDIAHKAAFEAPGKGHVPPIEGGEHAEGTVDVDRIRDLTNLLGTDGALTWDVPAGAWTILRIGHTATGRTNHPAMPRGRGLEVDKMSRPAMDAFFAGMMQMVIDDCGPLVGRVLNNALIDSYEVGSQNWTPEFREEFVARRGYDPLPWLVTLTGRVVGSRALSERFLWDYRRTIAELFRDNYFGYFAELCRKHGMLASVEPYGNGPFDDLAAGTGYDVPMGEFWVGSRGSGSLKLAASIAHTTGRRIVGAESFTANWDNGKWQNDPYSLKALGDRVFCMGITRYIFHRYAAQPWGGVVPGMTMGPWGFHFERTNTWWEPGAAWIDYISRCQYLLQQGLFVGDVCYYVGEDSPAGFRVGNPALPAGYDYDGISRELLLEAVAVRDGRIVLPDGMSYGILVLPPVRTMTPAVASKVRQLVADGATILGPRPTSSPSLSGYPECDEQVARIAAQVWGDCDGTSVTSHEFGKGRIIWGQPLAEALADLGTVPDFSYSAAPGVELLYIHRTADDTDMYFVSNQSQATESVECSFRASGKRPEFWRPDRGTIEPVAAYSEAGGRTTVPMVLDPHGSVFVVFRPADAPADPVVAFTRDGRPAQELQFEPGGVLEVRRAVYGILADPDRQVDVTEQLRAMVRNGVLHAPATNRIAGDPAPMVVKQLRVDYVLDGRE
ncbi:MAG: hypothetical protein KAX19_01520, partial [Candidatus Brocadiae bacterium]|nr:hypothetical protein [Candidatus Brocadiia bacterium]